MALARSPARRRWRSHLESPDETVELRSVKSLVAVGRCKIAPSKGTEFVDRVEFPNEWRVGDVHGLVHDGLQGDGSLELRIDWKVENEKTGALEARVALLTINPWLAYGCSEGARLSMRKPGGTEGRCAYGEVLLLLSLQQVLAKHSTCDQSEAP